MSVHTDNHHIIKDKEGNPLSAVLPYDEYIELIQRDDNSPTIPDEVMRLMIMEDCNIVKAWRVHKGLTQKEAATKMGITQASFSRYETADVNIQTGTLQKIADALGIDVQQVLSTWGDQGNRM